MKRKLFLAALAGFLASLSNPTHNLWLCAIVGMTVLFRITHDMPWKLRFTYGYVTGLVMFVFTLAWTRQFTAPGWLALAAFQALLFGLVAVLIPPRRWRSLAFPAALFLVELFRISWPFGGFPMGGFTSAFATSPFIPTVALVGEVGLVFVVGLCAVAVSEFFRYNPARWIVALAFLFIAILLPVFGARHNTTPFDAIGVATVQAGGPLGVRLEEQQPAHVFANHYSQTSNVAEPTDLIVWPENVIETNGPVDESIVGDMMGALAQSRSTHIGAGVVEDLPGHHFRNAFVVWGPDGTVVDRYEKVQRVPFGEYVPGRRWFDKFADLSQVPSDAIVGNGDSTVSIGNQRSAAIALSYEGLFSRRVRAGVREGGQIVLIPTNAASYKSSVVAQTQVLSARFRAVESGRWVVQSAPTGLSAIIDSEGRVLAQSAISEPSVLQHQAELRKGSTPYIDHGNTPLAIVALACTSTAWLPLARSGFVSQGRRRRNLRIGR